MPAIFRYVKPWKLYLFSLRPIKVPVPFIICLSYTVQQFLIIMHHFYSVEHKNLVDT